MKLLIVTQKVDRADPILGFFHAWIAEFAKRCDSVIVIAQQVGAHDLPRNVTVLSLGKEAGTVRLFQILRFWNLIFSHRKDYEAVFVHMTPVWINLGAPIWITLRKRMYLWYEIKRGSAQLSLALLFVRKVFMASEYGLPKKSKKQIVTGHGIDTALFRPDPSKREPGHLVSVGRLTRIKHYEIIVKALADLPDCRLTIAGGTITAEDKAIEHDLRELMHRLNVANRVEIGWVAPEDMPLLLQRADIFLHAAQGGLDKAVLQAMACGTPVVSASVAAQSVPIKHCMPRQDVIAKAIRSLLKLSSEEHRALGSKLRAVVEEDHNLSQCISRIVQHIAQ